MSCKKISSWKQLQLNALEVDRITTSALWSPGCTASLKTDRHVEVTPTGRHAFDIDIQGCHQALTKFSNMLNRCGLSVSVEHVCVVQCVLAADTMMPYITSFSAVSSNLHHDDATFKFLSFVVLETLTPPFWMVLIFHLHAPQHNLLEDFADMVNSNDIFRFTQAHEQPGCQTPCMLLRFLMKARLQQSIHNILPSVTWRPQKTNNFLSATVWLWTLHKCTASCSPLLCLWLALQIPL